jgi:hypothetical protein
MTNVEKTIPSEDVELAWLAGIIDGEGTIGVYKVDNGKRKPYHIFNFTIVNTDAEILNKAESILKNNNIFFSKYIHNNKNPVGFLPTKPCYVITVRRRDDFEQIINLIEKFLVGSKRNNIKLAKEYLAQNPRKMKPVYTCNFCKKQFTGRKRQFCTLTCWHNFSTGDKNPNFRHGNYIARND